MWGMRVGRNNHGDPAGLRASGRAEPTTHSPWTNRVLSSGRTQLLADAKTLAALSSGLGLGTTKETPE